MEEIIKRKERGWSPYFLVCATRCQFRRTTLLESTVTGATIVISTLGLFQGQSGDFEAIGPKRYFETTAFAGNYYNQRVDANVSKRIEFDSPWSIDEAYAVDKADDMHEIVVEELRLKLLAGYQHPAAPVHEEY